MEKVVHVITSFNQLYKKLVNLLYYLYYPPEELKYFTWKTMLTEKNYFIKL